MINSNFDVKNTKKPKTISIDAKYKEIYYVATQAPIKESPEELKHRYAFWNYMMNVSMQNAVTQMTKRAKT